MIQRLLYVLYAIEFLIALIAIFTVWSQVGGQGHLDYMAWYWKAAIAFPAAFSVVQLTIALAADPPRPWWRIVAWILALVLLSVVAGAITYYYHLNEPQDDNEEDPGKIAPAVVRIVGHPDDLLGPHWSGYRRPICRRPILPAVPSRGVRRAIGVGPRAIFGSGLVS